MRWKTLTQAFREGAEESKRLKLDRKENWTPLLIYIHASRLILGAILGFLAGFLWGKPLW